MPEFVAVLACALLALLGFALLALSQERHFEAVYGAGLPPGHRTRIQRTTGFTMIGLSLLLCVGSEGAGLGSLLWLVMISAAAMAIAFTLSWRPHWLRILGLAVKPVAERRANETRTRSICTDQRE